MNDSDKDMQEYVEETSKPSHSEAPASVNIKCWIDGYGVMFTFRGEKATDVVDSVVKLVELAKKSNWKTKWDDDAVPTQPNRVDSDPDWVAEDGPDWCGIHKTKMRQYTKNGQSWYSHQAPDGKWCSGK